MSSVSSFRTSPPGLDELADETRSVSGQRLGWSPPGPLRDGRGLAYSGSGTGRSPSVSGVGPLTSCPGHHGNRSA
jgi:hypothetical protein